MTLMLFFGFDRRAQIMGKRNSFKFVGGSAIRHRKGKYDPFNFIEFGRVPAH